jgi:hypothetical protein
MTMGIFAGRGDVVLAMGLALIVGMWLGWYLKAKQVQLSAWWADKKK